MTKHDLWVQRINTFHLLRSESGYSLMTFDMNTNSEVSLGMSMHDTHEIACNRLSAMPGWLQ